MGDESAVVGYENTRTSTTLVAPYDVATAAGSLVGSIFGVAQYAASSGANVEAAVADVFDLAKVSTEVWSVGTLIYVGASKLATTVSTSNKLIGVATAAAQNPSATGRVRLNGASIS